jgi:hypothetical protein
MSFFNIPDIFHFGDFFRQGYESRYERKIGKDSRNIALLEPLEATLGKLEDIRFRIGSRIEKETASGTDMSQAVDLLRIADISLSDAEQAVAVATSTIDGPHPRPPYMESQAAYAALNQAKDTLNAVLDSITSAVDQASSSPRQLSQSHVKKPE